MPVGSLAGIALLALAGPACEGGSASAAGHAPGTGQDESPGVVPVAELAAADGDVRWQRVADGAWTRVASGKRLRPAEAVQTMEGAHATVAFPRGGSSADLGPLTTLRIPEQSPEVRRLSHLRGHLTARLKGDGPVERMEVQLPPGTLFLQRADEGSAGDAEARVDVDEGRTAISMLRGSGRLQRSGGEEITVAPARFIEVDDEGRVTDEGQVGPKVVLRSPEDGDHVRVRRTVTFAWEPLPEAQRYRVELVGAGGVARALEVPRDQSTVAVDVEAGTYRWRVRALREDRPLPAGPARTLTVAVDREPPLLIVRSPEDGMTVTRATVRVVGRTEPGATVAVDGTPVAVSAAGAFSVAHPIDQGLTNVVVQARDPAGNVRTVSRTVVRP
jgi:hypothetical protein